MRVLEMSARIQKAAVIGSGTMGNGIAHVLAASGRDVTLIDVRQDLLDKAMATIRANMDRQVAKQALKKEDAEAALKRLRAATRVEDAAKAELVVEAVPERMELKKEVFRALDAACGPETILASNTSSLPITVLAAATKRPAKVMGMHFMNPVPVMKLVELIRGVETSEETFQAVRALTVDLGKTPVCSQDYPGFISNRVLMPMINEACFALMEGVATKEDIDTVMKLGMAHPMGPLTLADFIGLDVCLNILEFLQQSLGDPKYRPCPLLRKMVEAGRLGKKTGRGFYDYK
ncbi:MAG TPA: 3-hydroxybutyryl-CoA dehydrogenase [Elusimicrobiota bacterium]|jgi:3-hydroxybutyryl-CoA dehydrogenase|nr:3-hydroxybutyryl-CoA dehydrogenase [Elusimicrobiota bacterium]